MPKRLTILFLSREYPPETGGGGIGSYVAAIAPALAARGHDVHVLSCVSGQVPRDYRQDGAWIHRRDTVRLPFRSLVRRLPSSVARLECALSCYIEATRLGVEADVVEAPDWMAEGLVFAVAGPTPIVGHLHTPLRVIVERGSGSSALSFDLRLADLLERLAIRQSCLLTSPSRLLVDDLGRNGWLGTHEPRIIRYGVDAYRWGGLPSPAMTRPLVLAVGRLERRKAPDVLVEASSKLATVDGLDVVLIGREDSRFIGQARSPLRQRRRTGPFSLQGLSERARMVGAPIRFVESVPRNELHEWYAAARVVVVPSRYDNFPFVSLEAMAAGRAVVCTTMTGTAELADESAAITVVPSDDPSALAAAIRPFLEDSVLAARAGARAQAIVGQSCDLDLVSVQREACYRQAIAASHRGLGWRRLAWRLVSARAMHKRSKAALANPGAEESES